MSASRVPSIVIAIGFASESVWIQRGRSASGKKAPDASPSTLMPIPITPPPRRNVTIAAAASSPSPQTNGTKHISRTRLGRMPLGAKSSPSRERDDEQQHRHADRDEQEVERRAIRSAPWSATSA